MQWTGGLLVIFYSFNEIWPHQKSFVLFEMYFQKESTNKKSNFFNIIT